MRNEIKLFRARTAAELARTFGQDRFDAFEKALERFDAQQKLTPPPRSWSETILDGNSVRFNLQEDGENWVEVEWYGYFDEEMANNWYDMAQINSPYDCTGREFMYGIHYFEAFGGYVVMTYWALDV